MNCRYCENEKKLLNAHIIPARFFEELKTGPGPLKEYSSRPEQFPKKSHLGVYDQNILCMECEQGFGPYDNYAYEVFLSGKFKKTEVNDEVFKGYFLEGADYAKLKLFFLSVIWRASVSTHPYYKEVKLGPYEKVIKDRLKAKDPGKNTEFPVMLAKVNFPKDMPSMLQPYRAQITDDKLFMYVIPFARYKAYLKVDKRILDDNPLILQPNKPVYFMYEDWDTSIDARFTRKLIDIDDRRKKK